MLDYCKELLKNSVTFDPYIRIFWAINNANSNSAIDYPNLLDIDLRYCSVDFSPMSIVAIDSAM